MALSPVLVFHICAGTIGLLSGAVAMSFRKGSHRHRVAGNVFVISMLSLGASGAYMGFLKQEALNVAMGVLTLYLVATAWRTAKRGDQTTGIFDWVVLLVPLAVGAGLVAYGLKGGAAAGAYFTFGFVALLFAAGDVRMLMRGGVSGAQRMARHLVRMCFAFFIASGSIFLARPHLFPALLRKTGIIFLLGILPLLLMIFWLLRVRFTSVYKSRPAPSGSDVYTVRT